MKRNLHAHQRMLAEMLFDFDEACSKCGARYSLFAGTALGAARHQGFIPWDDDLDVIMLRSEYDRLLDSAPELFDGEKYYFQSEFSEHWPMHFSKLRRNDTACMERYVPRDPKTHQGVYIDVFPCDNLSDNPLVRRLQFLASKVVIAKCLDKRGYLTDSKLKKATIVLCRCVPLGPMLRLTKLESASRSNMVHSFFGASSRYAKAIFPREWITDTAVLRFEGGEYPVSSHWDELLTVLYGDYMTPTPEGQRECKVHAEIVDLDRSYENYLEVQKTMQFQEYTRSIR